MKYFELTGVDEWIAWLKTCQNSELEQMNDRIARSVVIQGFNNTARHTPRRTGRLVQSLNQGAPESYTKIQVTASSFIVVYGTCVPYAEYVETGFSQAKRKGQFVPGYWSGGTFHYVKGSKMGMVLTGKVVEGRHMFEKSLDDFANGDLETIVLFEFRRLYSLLF